jgi:ELWxxDGT repeat protein
MQVFLHPPVLLPEEIRSLGREVGAGRLLGGARGSDEEGQSERRRGHAPWVRRIGVVRHPILVLTILFAPTSAFSQGLPTGPEEPLRLLRDGETPGWGLDGRLWTGFLRGLDRGEFAPGKVEALPRSLREEADWKDRLGVPEDVVELDGVGYFNDDRRLWRTDGTRLGTYPIVDLPAYRFVRSSPRSLFRLGDTLFLLAANDAREVVLFRRDGERLLTLRRWGASSVPSGFSLAGGFAWFGLRSDEGDRLYRVDAEGDVVAVRDLRDQASASVEPGARFRGVFEVGSHLVAIEFAFAAQIRDPASEAPEFVALVQPNVRSIVDPRPAAFDSSLWFVGVLPGLEELYRSDGTSQGTVRVLVDRTLSSNYRPLRRERVMIGDLLYDGNAEVVGEVVLPNSPRPIPKRDGLFAVRRREADPPVGPPLAYEVLRLDVETGTVALVVETATSAAAPFWIDTGENLFLASFDPEGVPSFRRWTVEGLGASIELRFRGGGASDPELTALVGASGLLTARRGTEEGAWIDRRTGERRLRSVGRFLPTADGGVVIAAVAEPLGLAVSRFDPRVAAEPRLLRTFPGRGAILGLVQEHLLVQTLASRGGASFRALDVLDGTQIGFRPSDPDRETDLVIRTLARSAAWFHATVPTRATVSLARWTPPDPLPELLLEYPSGLRPDLVPVGSALWGVQRFISDEDSEWRLFARVSEGIDPNSPALVLPGPEPGAFRTFQRLLSERLGQALLQFEGQLVHLTEDQAVTVDGLPSEYEFSQAVLTDWGAYVPGRTLEAGMELYRLVQPELGTPAERVDIAPGPLSSSPSGFTPAYGGHVFLADDGVHGRELWFDDGEEVRMVCDLVPGPLSGAEPHGLLADDEGVYLRVDTGERGRALWRVARSVVLGETPCPSLELLEPVFAAEPEEDPPSRGDDLAGREGGCRDVGPSFGLWVWLVLGGLGVRIRSRRKGWA